MSLPVLAEAGAAARSPDTLRLDYLDATRAFALVLGIVFHASLSFMPVFMGWAVQDISTSPAIGIFATISHSFRMELFFLLAGFFSGAALRRKGVGEFVRSRAWRIVVPFVAGWFLLRPLLVSGWIMGSASLRGDYDFWAGLRAGWQSLGSLPAGLFTGSHLWFLYYLTLVTALLLVVRAGVRTVRAWREAVPQRADAFVGWLARSGWSTPALVAPTAVALWFMRYWGMDTPDQSLRPHLAVLAVYGGFFALGWMVGRQPETMKRLGRLSPRWWTAAAVGVAGTLWLGRFQPDLAHPHHTAARVGFVVSYASMMWGLVFLTIGAFRRWCPAPRPWIRYVADSSYWLYLVHLPIVVWLQVAVAEVQLHWSLKLAFVSGATLGLALLSYDLFVRSTWLGALLTGRRRARALAARLLAGGQSRPAPSPDGASQ